MLPRKNRLTKSQFQNFGKQSQKYRGEYGMLILDTHSDNNTRFGFIVSKKIGNAVHRHRMTRVLREIFRKYILNISNVKGIYIAYKYCDNYEELEKEIDLHFKNASRDFKMDRVKNN